MSASLSALKQLQQGNPSLYDPVAIDTAALQAIARHGELSQAGLGHAIGMEPANVHGLVARLQKKGLISATRPQVRSG